MSFKNFIRKKHYDFLTKLGGVDSSSKRVRKATAKLYFKLIKNHIIARNGHVEDFEMQNKAKLSGFKLGKYSYYGENCHIFPGVEIGKYTSIACQVQIGAAMHPTDFLSTSPWTYERVYGVNEDKYSAYSLNTTIGNDVWIGAFVFIKQGVTIGDGAVIGAGAVVTKDVPSYAIVAGVPAKVLRYRFEPDVIADLLELKWWDLDEDIVKTLPVEDPEKCIDKLKKIKSKDNY